ncbi:MAG: hypothetical protein OEV44_13025 [Spirochaetota bacterium]|nr:hypothetical protein [Spirochaetota bacterium]
MKLGGSSGISENYKDELFRINCIEISSEIINPKYEEYPILFVDNALKGSEKEEYEDYIFYGRNGMPNWKDYYAIKNLVETLKEIDGLENKDAAGLIERVEESFLSALYSRFYLKGNKFVLGIKSLIFPILQKLELFYPESKSILKFILKLNLGEIANNDIAEALNEFRTIFQDDHYFLDDEKLFIELCFNYFNPEKKKLFEEKVEKLKSEKVKIKLPEHLSTVKIV